MFILLGIGFIIFQGSNALLGVYESAGASDLSASVEATLGSLIREQGGLATIGVVLTLAAVVTIGLRAWRGRDRGDSPDDWQDWDDEADRDDVSPESASAP